MGSVDLADQLLEPYHYDRKSLAWFKKIGIHFLFRIALNAFIAYRNACKGTTEFLQFLEILCKELLTEHNLGAAALAEVYTIQKVHGPRLQQPSSNIHHFVKWEEQKKQKRCRVCHPVRKATRYYCAGDPGICSVEHFKTWQSEGKGKEKKTRTQEQESSTSLSEEGLDQPSTSGTVHRPSMALHSTSGTVPRRSGRISGKARQKRNLSSSEESI
ncbi:hypothetical protein Pmani_013697 [Petrolisthes manimaculis]|uniref:Uncharacterized protein n=1 Tax=Petrolisthes manimaculis TaxID=1843537 RepID=A0AAE1PVV8_9EUCA|nr:hypothetical protein Pmani_013697 [Petrolisthes manimaculis]